jgi:hypothetical protein
MFQVRVEIKAIIASPLGVPWVNHPVRRRRDGKQGLYAAVFGWLSCRTTGANWDKSRKIKTRELNAYQIADARRFGGCLDDFSSRLMLDYILWGSLLCLNLKRRKEMQLRQTDPNLSSFLNYHWHLSANPYYVNALLAWNNCICRANRIIYVLLGILSSQNHYLHKNHGYQYTHKPTIYIYILEEVSNKNLILRNLFFL